MEKEAKEKSTIEIQDLSYLYKPFVISVADKLNIDCSWMIDIKDWRLD